MLKKRRGEIGTVVMLIALAVMSIIGFSSSKFLSSKKTSSTQATGGVVRYGSANCTCSQICGISSNYVSNSQEITSSGARKCTCQEDTPASICGINYNNPPVVPPVNENPPNKCISGAYMALVDCVNACGVGNCQSCKLNTVTKYECKVGGNLELCKKPRTYASSSNCKLECSSDCTQCTVGDSVRYECGGAGPTMAPYATPTPVSGGGSGSAKPWDGCLNYLNYTECKEACQLEHTGYTCESTSGTTDKKWCCPPEVIDYCKENNGFCSKDREDCNYGQVTDLTSVNYCKSIGMKVCCKKSGTPPPPPADESVCNPINCPEGTTGGPYYTIKIKEYDWYYVNKADCEKKITSCGTNCGVGLTGQNYIKTKICKAEGQNPAADEKIPVPMDNSVRGKTCQVNKTNLSVSGKDISIENNNDLWNDVPCNHIFLTSVDNISVFRECPTFIQGKFCVYSCYKGTGQVNCQKVHDVITSKPSITFINKKNNNIWIKAAVETPSTEIILTETEISKSQYIQGFFSCTLSSASFTSVKIKYLYKESKNGEYTSYDIKSPSCKSLLVSIQ